MNELRVSLTGEEYNLARHALATLIDIRTDETYTDERHALIRVMDRQVMDWADREFVPPTIVVRHTWRSEEYAS